MGTRSEGMIDTGEGSYSTQALLGDSPANKLRRAGAQVGRLGKICMPTNISPHLEELLSNQAKPTWATLLPGEQLLMCSVLMEGVAVVLPEGKP